MRKLFSSLVAVFLLVVLAGCRPTETVERGPSGKAREDMVPTAKVTPVVQEQSPPVPTAEQMARNAAIRAGVEAVRSGREAGEVKSLPKWAANHYAAYEARDYTREKAAFQRSVGWGTGKYKGKPFYWFAYTNTDAYLQFELSVAIPELGLGKIIDGRKDNYGRSREALYPDAEWMKVGSPTHVPPETWIGDTNDWTDRDCTQPKFDICDIGAALDKSVADLNKDLPGLNLTVRGKFPW